MDAKSKERLIKSGGFCNHHFHIVPRLVIIEYPQVLNVK